MNLFLFRRSGPFRLAFLARLYESFTFRGLTLGQWGIGVVHFKPVGSSTPTTPEGR